MVHGPLIATHKLSLVLVHGLLTAVTSLAAERLGLASSEKDGEREEVRILFHKRLFRQGSHLSCCGQNEELAIQQFVIDHNYVPQWGLEEQNEGKCLVKR